MRTLEPEVERLIRRKKAAGLKAVAICQQADDEDRDLTDEERKETRMLVYKIESLREQIQALK